MTKFDLDSLGDLILITDGEDFGIGTRVTNNAGDSLGSVGNISDSTAVVHMLPPFCSTFPPAGSLGGRTELADKEMPIVIRKPFFRHIEAKNRYSVALRRV